MQIQRLNSYQLEELMSTTSSTKAVKPSKSRPVANFFVPDGAGLNYSSRATGSHLPADHPDLVKGANILIDSLLAAQGHRVASGNTLISPASLSDKALSNYGHNLLKYAVADPESSVIGMQSPAIVPYLLGGIPLLGVETLVDRILEVMEFFPQMEKGTFAASTKLLGFAPWQTHAHVDLLEPVKDQKVSARQNYLLWDIRSGNWVDALLTQGAYGATMRKRMTALKPDACAWVQDLLNPSADHMTPLAAKGREPVQIFDRDFAVAVQRVYEKPWADLELTGDTSRTGITNDIQVLLARYIIIRQATKVRMSAQTLVGISLLTGISIAKFTEFAVYDCKRRGETFITAETIDQAIELINMSAAGAHMACERALIEHAMALRYSDMAQYARAQRLKSPKKPLWSANMAYYVMPEQKFKHKAENFNQ